MEVKVVTIEADKLTNLISQAVQSGFEAGIAELEKRLSKDGKEQSKYMTIVEAAEYIGVTRATLHRYCKAGNLKKVRMPNGQPRLLREEVENFCTRLTGNK